MLYNNNKNHRDRRNYEEWSVSPVFGRKGKKTIYGTFGTITTWKEAVERSEKMSWSKKWKKKEIREMKLRNRKWENSMVSSEMLGGSVKCFSSELTSYLRFHLHLVSWNSCYYQRANQPSAHSSARFPQYFLQQWLALVTQFQSLVFLCQCLPKGVPRQTNPPQRKAWGVHPSSLSSLVDVGPQGLVKSLEGGPVGDVATPTAHHQLEERGRAERRSVEEDLEGKYRRVKETTY